MENENKTQMVPQGAGAQGRSLATESAPDVETLVKQAVALAILREKSAMIFYQGVREALEDLGKAYNIDVYDYDGVDVEEKTYEFVAKYRVVTAEDSDGDVLVIVPDGKFKDYVSEIVDPDLFDALTYPDVYESEYDKLIERYLSLKLSKCLVEWSSAKEALDRASDAGFEIETIYHLDREYSGWVEYRIKAPTGEKFVIWERVYYCNYCIYGRPHSQSIGVQKCFTYKWEKDEV